MARAGCAHVYPATARHERKPSSTACTGLRRSRTRLDCVVTILLPLASVCKRLCLDWLPKLGVMLIMQHAQLSPSGCGIRVFRADLPSVRPSGRSARPFCSCASTRSNQQQQQQLSRRQALGTALGTGYLLLSSPAYAARGLDRYIKKKGLDPIDTYVPPVLQARDQLLKAGEIMGAHSQLACMRLEVWPDSARCHLVL